jgi:hypothetical protein
MAAMTNYLETELKALGASVTRSKAESSVQSKPQGENIYGTLVPA